MLNELYHAAQTGDTAQMKSVLERGATIDTVSGGKRFIQQAINAYDLELMTSLFRQGAKVHDPDIAVECLHMAAEEGNAQLLKLLFEHGARPYVNDVISGVDDTALHLAARGGHTEAVDILLSHCADVKAVTSTRRCSKQFEFYIDSNVTCLHVASEEGYETIVKDLLKRKAEVNAVTFHGFTPLLLAVMENRMEVARILLEQGAWISPATKSGEVAHEIAEKRNYSGILNLLEEHMEKVLAQTETLRLDYEREFVEHYVSGKQKRKKHGVPTKYQRHLIENLIPEGDQEVPNDGLQTVDDPDIDVSSTASSDSMYTVDSTLEATYSAYLTCESSDSGDWSEQEDEGFNNSILGKQLMIYGDSSETTGDRLDDRYQSKSSAEEIDGGEMDLGGSSTSTDENIGSLVEVNASRRCDQEADPTKVQGISDQKHKELPDVDLDRNLDTSAAGRRYQPDRSGDLSSSTVTGYGRNIRDYTDSEPNDSLNDLLNTSRHSVEERPIIDGSVQYRGEKTNNRANRHSTGSTLGNRIVYRKPVYTTIRNTPRVPLLRTRSDPQQERTFNTFSSYGSYMSSAPQTEIMPCTYLTTEKILAGEDEKHEQMRRVDETGPLKVEYRNECDISPVTQVIFERRADSFSEPRAITDPRDQNLMANEINRVDPTEVPSRQQLSDEEEGRVSSGDSDKHPEEYPHGLTENFNYNANIDDTIDAHAENEKMGIMKCINDEGVDNIQDSTPTREDSHQNDADISSNHRQNTEFKGREGENYAYIDEEHPYVSPGKDTIKLALFYLNNKYNSDDSAGEEDYPSVPAPVTDQDKITPEMAEQKVFENQDMVPEIPMERTRERGYDASRMHRVPHRSQLKPRGPSRQETTGNNAQDAAAGPETIPEELHEEGLKVSKSNEGTGMKKAPNARDIQILGDPIQRGSGVKSRPMVTRPEHELGSGAKREVDVPSSRRNNNVEQRVKTKDPIKQDIFSVQDTQTQKQEGRFVVPTKGKNLRRSARARGNIPNPNYTVGQESSYSPGPQLLPNNILQTSVNKEVDVKLSPTAQEGNITIDKGGAIMIEDHTVKYLQEAQVVPKKKQRKKKKTDGDKVSSKSWKKHTTPVVLIGHGGGPHLVEQEDRLGQTDVPGPRTLSIPAIDPSEGTFDQWPLRSSETPPGSLPTAVSEPNMLHLCDTSEDLTGQREPSEEDIVEAVSGTDQSQIIAKIDEFIMASISTVRSKYSQAPTNGHQSQPSRPVDLTPLAQNRVNTPISGLQKKVYKPMPDAAKTPVGGPVIKELKPPMPDPARRSVGSPVLKELKPLTPDAARTPAGGPVMKQPKPPTSDEARTPVGGPIKKEPKPVTPDEARTPVGGPEMKEPKPPTHAKARTPVGGPAMKELKPPTPDAAEEINKCTGEIKKMRRKKKDGRKKRHSKMEKKDHPSPAQKEYDNTATLSPVSDHQRKTVCVTNLDDYLKEEVPASNAHNDSTNEEPLSPRSEAKSTRTVYVTFIQKSPLSTEEQLYPPSESNMKEPLRKEQNAIQCIDNRVSVEELSPKTYPPSKHIDKKHATGKEDKIVPKEQRPRTSSQGAILAGQGEEIMKTTEQSRDTGIWLEREDGTAGRFTWGTGDSSKLQSSHEVPANSIPGQTIHYVLNAPGVQYDVQPMFSNSQNGGTPPSTITPTFPSTPIVGVQSKRRRINPNYDHSPHSHETFRRSTGELLRILPLPEKDSKSRRFGSSPKQDVNLGPREAPKKPRPTSVPDVYVLVEFDKGGVSNLGVLSKDEPGMEDSSKDGSAPNLPSPNSNRDDVQYRAMAGKDRTPRVKSLESINIRTKEIPQQRNILPDPLPLSQVPWGSVEYTPTTSRNLETDVDFGKQWRPQPAPRRTIKSRPIVTLNEYESPRTSEQVEKGNCIPIKATEHFQSGGIADEAESTESPSTARNKTRPIAHGSNGDQLPPSCANKEQQQGPSTAHSVHFPQTAAQGSEPKKVAFRPTPKPRPERPKLPKFLSTGNERPDTSFSREDQLDYRTPQHTKRPKSFPTRSEEQYEEYYTPIQRRLSHESAQKTRYQDHPGIRSPGSHPDRSPEQSAGDVTVTKSQQRPLVITDVSRRRSDPTEMKRMYRRSTPPDVRVRQQAPGPQTLPDNEETEIW